MSIAIWFWIFMLLWLIAGGWWGFSSTSGRSWRFGAVYIPWILFALIGWHLWGSPVKG